MVVLMIPAGGQRTVVGGVLLDTDAQNLGGLGQDLLGAVAQALHEMSDDSLASSLP
jgi:hypothetical protein